MAFVSSTNYFFNGPLFIRAMNTPPPPYSLTGWVNSLMPTWFENLTLYIVLSSLPWFIDLWPCIIIMIILDQVFFHPIGCKSEGGRHSKVSPVHHPQTLRSLEQYKKLKKKSQAQLVQCGEIILIFILVWKCSHLYVMSNILRDSGEFYLGDWHKLSLDM